MGNQVRVIFKRGLPDSTIHHINALLDNHPNTDCFHVWTKQDNVDWLDDINNNPKSPQRHLKPKNGQLSMKMLRKIFKAWTLPNHIELDVAFGRTEPKQAYHLCQLLKKPQVLSQIQTINNAKDLVKLAYEPSQSKTQFAALELLNTPTVKPELRPKEDRREKVDGGVALLDYWSPAPNDKVWVSYGHVESPRFLMDDKYLDNKYNSLHKCSDGRGILLVPLLPFVHNANELIEKHWRDAWELGLRADFRTFAVIIYSAELADYKLIPGSSKEHALSEEDCKSILRNKLSKMMPYESVSVITSKPQSPYVVMKGRMEKAYYNNMNYAATTLRTFYGYAHYEVQILVDELRKDLSNRR